MKKPFFIHRANLSAASLGAEVHRAIEDALRVSIPDILENSRVASFVAVKEGQGYVAKIIRANARKDEAPYSESSPHEDIVDAVNEVWRRFNQGTKKPFDMAEALKAAGLPIPDEQEIRDMWDAMAKEPPSASVNFENAQTESAQRFSKPKPRYQVIVTTKVGSGTCEHHTMEDAQTCVAAARLTFGADVEVRIRDTTNNAITIPELPVSRMSALTISYDKVNSRYIARDEKKLAGTGASIEQAIISYHELHAEE